MILEGLDLSDVDPGEYTLVCFPLKIAGGDGGPHTRGPAPGLSVPAYAGTTL